MKKILIVVTGIIYSSLGYIAGADVQEVTEPAETAQRRGAAAFGTEVSYVRYREPGVMEDEGVMYGIVGSYTYRRLLMFRMDGRFSYGEVDYTSNNTGEMDNVKDFVIETRAVTGVDLTIEKIRLTPYLGIGYRYLNDDSSGRVTTTGHAGYERQSNYIYSPLGLEAALDMGKGWFVDVYFEYDLFWWGEQYSFLSDANSNLSDLSNMQKQGYGLRGGLRVTKKVRTFDLVLEPFIRYWEIDKSEVAPLQYAGVTVGYGFEPKNDSLEIGLQFALRF